MAPLMRSKLSARDAVRLGHMDRVRVLTASNGYQGDALAPWPCSERHAHTRGALPGVRSR